MKRFAICTGLSVSLVLFVVACGTSEHDFSDTNQPDGSIGDVNQDVTQKDSATSDAAQCIPKTCVSFNADCGEVNDGCNVTLKCGSCPEGMQCGGSGPNKCGSSVCAPKTCAALGTSCGNISDGCAATLNCGTCANGLTCGANNQCEGQDAGDGSVDADADVQGPLAPCVTTTANNCSLVQSNSGESVSGICANGTSGTCAYSCTNGLWTPVNNTCQTPSGPCSSTTMSNCSLPQANSGGSSSGTCANGTTGTCSYSCSNGLWTPITNTCQLPLSPCSATILNNCSLSQTNSGGSASGACTNGMTGACSYSCSNGLWSAQSNNCQVPMSPCSATTIGNCSLSQVNHGGSSGACANGTVGSCGYSCSNGTWSAQSNNCQQPSPCSSTTISNCSLNQTTSGSSASGTCSNGTTGSCGYSCSNGLWTQQSNSCVAVVNGACGASKNSCVSGTMIDSADSTTHYNWKCSGTNGGQSPDCSLAKAVPSVACGIVAEGDSCHHVWYCNNNTNSSEPVYVKYYQCTGGMLDFSYDASWVRTCSSGLAYLYNSGCPSNVVDPNTIAH